MKTEKREDVIERCANPLVAITLDEHRRLLDDSRMLKALISAGARGTKIWNKASRFLREDFGQ